MTHAETTEREISALKAMGITWPRPPLPRDASAMRRPLADATSRQRRPLGLSIVPDDNPEDERLLSPLDGQDLEHGPFYDLREHDKEFLGAGVPFEVLYLAVNACVSITNTAHDALKKRIGEQQTKIVGLETEIARLTAKVAEAQSKVNELAFVSERLRIEARGPAGERGPMGRDGHDGPPGARGERGERGETGKAAPTIVAWSIDDANFSAVPIMADGRRGPTLHLRGLFETYDGQVDAATAAEEIDAAASQRAVVEREAAAVRLGLPPR